MIEAPVTGLGRRGDGTQGRLSLLFADCADLYGVGRALNVVTQSPPRSAKHGQEE